MRALLRLCEYSAHDGIRLVREGDSLSARAARGLDLFGVSAFKSGGSGCEVKFFDRLPAIQLLLALGGDEDSGPAEFYKALRAGAADAGASEDVPGSGGEPAESGFEYDSV